MDDNRTALQDWSLDLHTSQPGRVVKFYADTYEVDVELVCKRPVPHIDGGFVYEDPPILPRCPVCSFGNSVSWLKVPLVPGDLVWLISPECSTDEFVDTGETAQPQQVQRHGLLGSLALPFVLPSRTPTGCQVSLGGSGADFVALASKVTTAIGDLTTAVQNMALAGNSGGPLVFTAPVYASVAATEVKAK